MECSAEEEEEESAEGKEVENRLRAVVRSDHQRTYIPLDPGR